jgi:MFS superfamily sulfate permease-like transporter
VLAVPVILNKIPLATATILILVGYKLAKPATILFEKGKYQFIPFIATGNSLCLKVLLGIVYYLY